MEVTELIVAPADKGKRLDVFIVETLEDKSRSFIQQLIEKNNINVNGENKSSNYKIRSGDIIKVSLPDATKLSLEGEAIPLDILYEDKDLIVVNKAQGMVVHPATGIYTGTLVNAILNHCTDLSGINGILRPGIVHRIDKDTSGVLVIAKNDISHNSLAQQLKEHSMKREYIALVEGVIKDEKGTVDAPLGRNPKERIKMAVVKDGRRAVTHYRVITRYNSSTLIQCILETGRTHQIRVHMAFIGHPVVGDPVYGYKKQRFNLKGQLLHARILGFIHPTTAKYMEFTAPLPKHFENILKLLENELKNI